MESQYVLVQMMCTRVHVCVNVATALLITLYGYLCRGFP